MLKNKEITDALCLLLHCSLKDKEYETQKEQFDLVYDYIKQLERQIEIKDAYLDIIYDISIDYDGCNTAKSLKELIDEFRKWTDFALKNNDTECMFVGSKDKEFNILHEELPEN